MKVVLYEWKKITICSFQFFNTLKVSKFMELYSTYWENCYSYRQLVWMQVEFYQATNNWIKSSHQLNCDSEIWNGTSDFALSSIIFSYITAYSVFLHQSSIYICYSIYFLDFALSSIKFFLHDCQFRTSSSILYLYFFFNFILQWPLPII